MINRDFDPESFMDNDFIRSISGNEQWTISTKDKMPVDAKQLMNHKVCGASFANGNNPLVTLPHLFSIISRPTNAAYRLCAADSFVVLDIEAKCPKEIKYSLLGLPYLYAERSMSGKGFHLIFNRPEDTAYENILNSKSVVRDKNGYYEILIAQHYVTFTNNHDNFPDIKKHNDYTFTQVFDKLARETKVYQESSISVNSLPRLENVTYGPEILYELIQKDYNKTPDNFNNRDGVPDLSAYEFGMIGFYRNRLEYIIDKKNIKNKFSIDEKIVLIYEAVKYKVLYRPKHDTKRCGMPWLMWLVKRSYECSGITI